MALCFDRSRDPKPLRAMRQRKGYAVPQALGVVVNILLCCLFCVSFPACPLKSMRFHQTRDPTSPTIHPWSIRDGLKYFLGFQKGFRS